MATILDNTDRPAPKLEDERLEVVEDWEYVNHGDEREHMSSMH